MKPLVIVMLVLQATLLVSTVWAMLRPPPVSDPRGRIWTSLFVALLVPASVSYGIADREGGTGAHLVEYGSGVLLGMAILCLAMALRLRMGKDAAA